MEDLLVGGFGAVEMEATGDPARPLHLWAVDGATIQIDQQMERRSREAALCAGELAHGPGRADPAATTTS